MLHNTITSILRWARITKASDDDGQFALQQLEYLGKTANCLIVFPYGIHGNVPADALALMMSMQGNADNRAAFAWTPKIRPKLKDGEVSFYHPPTGGTVIWKENGNLAIKTSADVTIECDNLTVTGDLNVTGSMINNGKDVGDTHGHTQANDSDGDSQAAISGVT